MKRRDDVYSAKGVVKRLKRIRDTYKNSSASEPIEVDLDRTSLSPNEVEKLNRRMPRLVKILNSQPDHYQLYSGFSKLPGITLGGASLRNADFAGTDLSEANLERANLTNTNLRGVDLRKSTLKGAILDGAYIRKTRFDGSDMKDARIQNAGPSLDDPDRMRESRYS